MTKWELLPGHNNYLLDNREKIVFLSYNPNRDSVLMEPSDLDSENPETAIVLIDDKYSKFFRRKANRYLIYRGDWRDELEKIYPDVDKLKEHWKQYGGHFWSDSLDDEEGEEV